MSQFKIQNISDKTIIEIISMNIDNENNILVFEDDTFEIISLNNFKNMILGTEPDSVNPKAKEATYKLFTHN
jgi:hypothetical protein